MAAPQKALARPWRAPFFDHGMVLTWALIYFSSCLVFVTSSKSILTQVPHRPWTLSFWQCASAAVCCRVWLLVRGEEIQRVSSKQWRYLLVASLTCWLGFGFANVACSVMSAALVETVKATSPVPQVLIAAFMGEGWPSRSTQKALAIVVVGVVLASLADTSVCASGLVASVLMNLAFSVSDNAVKASYRHPDRLGSSNLWFRSAQLSTVFALPAAMMEIAFGSASPLALVYEDLGLLHLGPLWPVVFLSGFAFFLYNQSICQLLDLVPMSTFAVLGSLRRTMTIVALTAYFGTEVSVMNVVGLGIVAVGFLQFVAQRPTAAPSVSKATHRSPVALHSNLGEASKDTLSQVDTSATLPSQVVESGDSSPVANHEELL